MAKIIFFIGKGGVGKSTVSALTALNYANRQKKTLLVSLDSAHNQQDIFKTRFSEKAIEITSNLYIIEEDIDKRIKAYLKKSSQKIQNNYNYQSAFSLKNYFNVLKHSPGIEEYAMLQAFEDIILTQKDKELIIFDMPPTAVSLRFFSLPKTGIIWLKQLTELRKAIHKKKEIISKVKFGKKQIETDKVKNQLGVLMKQHIRVNKLFQSENTNINIVLNNDQLSVNESIRINERLNELNLSTTHFVLNKLLLNNNYSEEIKALPKKISTQLPLNNKPLTGISELNIFLQKKGISGSLVNII